MHSAPFYRFWLSPSRIAESPIPRPTEKGISRLIELLPRKLLLAGNGLTATAQQFLSVLGFSI